MRQRPGLLVGQFEGLESRHGGVERGQRLGQQAQFEVSVGKLLFGDRQMLRQRQRCKATARGLQPRQRFAVATTRQVNQRHRLIDQRQRHLQVPGRGAHAGAGVDAQCLVEVAQHVQHIGQTDVGQDRLFVVADAREQHGGLAVMARRFGIVVAPQVQAAQVQAHAAGGREVAQRDEFALRLRGARGGVVMPAEHRQGHDLRYLRLCSRVGAAGLAEGGLGAVEADHGIGHLTPCRHRDAGRPFDQGLDLDGLIGRHASLTQGAQGVGGLGGAGGLSAPGFVAQVFQGPGQCQCQRVGAGHRCCGIGLEQAARPGRHGIVAQGQRYGSPTLTAGSTMSPAASRSVIT